jgi:uncharacterized protein
MPRLSLLLPCLALLIGAHHPARQQAMPQFVYVLRVVPRLHAESSWTAADNAATEAHFNRLKEATRAGTVILAGRTTESLDRTFGLVVFEAKTRDEANRFMLDDPAVRAGVMTAELHPYAVALMRR